MRLAFATLFAVLSGGALAQYTGGPLVEIMAIGSVDAGLKIFAVEAKQNGLQFSINEDGTFLLVKGGVGSTMDTNPPPGGWGAGDGSFTYVSKSRSSNCHLEGKFTETPAGASALFDIINPANLDNVQEGDRILEMIEECQGQNRSGVQMVCDDKTLMCSKL